MSHVHTLPLPSDHLDVLETVFAMLRERNEDYYGYERGDAWHIGLGSDTSIIDPKGEMATICTEDGKREDDAVNGRPLAKIAREFVAENSHSGDGGQIYGQVGFNYVAHIRGQA